MDDASGSGLREGSQVIALDDATSDIAGVSTAAGPNSDAAIAASGSDAPRHTQERDAEAGAAFERVWCIGHIRPSAWSQVHSARTVLADIVAQQAVGTDTSRQRWNASQPPAMRAS